MRKALKTFVFVGLLAVPLISQADPDKICDDLQKFVCAPGEYDDGTGLASNPTVLASEQSEIRDKVLKTARDGFEQVLKNPENVYFRKAVLSATGLSLSPRCTGAEDHPSPQCFGDMINGVMDIFAKQQSPTIANPYAANG